MQEGPNQECNLEMDTETMERHTQAQESHGGKQQA